MTYQGTTGTTDELFFDLVDLLGRDYVSPADHKRTGSLARICAGRMGTSVASVMAAAHAELTDEVYAA
jgi:hypothetical protein